MNKKILAIMVLVIAAILLVGTLIYQPSSVSVSSPKDATYIIDGHSFTLVNGVSEVSVAPGSASKIVTRYFGNEVVSDLDGDGRPDTAFILTQDTGGSGTFYYVVAALNTVGGYKGSQALLLGDRIAPQSTEVGTNGHIIVNYADRKPGEDFSIPPSVGKTLWLKLDPATMQFGEVVQDFEGEADPSVMKLDQKTWNWMRTIYSNGTTTLPAIPGKFTLTFKDNGTFSAATDCNGVGGEYVTNGNKIILTKMMSTLMYCDASQEQVYSG